MVRKLRIRLILFVARTLNVPIKIREQLGVRQVLP